MQIYHIPERVQSVQICMLKFCVFIEKKLSISQIQNLDLKSDNFIVCKGIHEFFKYSIFEKYSFFYLISMIWQKLLLFRVLNKIFFRILKKIDKRGTFSSSMINQANIYQVLVFITISITLKRSLMFVNMLLFARFVTYKFKYK